MALVTLANGTEITAATGGRPLDDAAPLVVLVHGAAMDRTVWAMQTRWLAHHGCSVLAVDLPGHGASPQPPLDSIATYAEWLVAALDGIERPVHVVGHSMGSFIAIETAKRRDLASVMLIGTAEAMPVHPALLEAAANNDPLAAQLMSGWAFAPLSRGGPHPSPGSSMAGGTQAMIAQAAPGVLHDDLAMCAAYDTALASAAEITVPVHMLLGQLDRMTPVGKAKSLAAAFPDASMTIVPGVGHMVQVEAPRITRQAIANASLPAAGV